MANEDIVLEAITEEDIKNRVKIARTQKDMTQQELAEAIDVTRQTIGLIENQKYNPTIILCLKLSYVLDVSLEKLFWLEVNNI